MADMMELPRIGCDEDWLDMAEGEQGVIHGRLDGPLRVGQTTMTVSNAAWELTVVSMPAGYHGRDHAAGATVRVIATRTEDGLEAATADVHVKQEGMA